MAKDPNVDHDPPRTRKSSMAGWVLAAVVILLLVLCAFSYFSNPNSPQNEPDQQPSTGQTQSGSGGAQ